MFNSSLVEWLSLVISGGNFIAVIAIIQYLRRLTVFQRRSRALLRFTQGKELAIVVSTSTNNVQSTVRGSFQAPNGESELAGHDKLNYPRPTISIWTTYAVSYITELSSVLRYRQTANIDISERLTRNQEDDLVLIGGSIKNRRAKDFVGRFNQDFTHLEIVRKNTDDPCEKIMTIGDRDYSFRLEEDELGEAITDRAIVVMWKNPFSPQGRWRRGIMCAGFTSRGTAAAARYLSQSVQDGTLRERCLSEGIPVKSKGAAPEFILVLDVRIINDSYPDVHVHDLIPLVKTMEPTELKAEIYEPNAAVGH